MHTTTPDGRYFVVKGQLWRCSNPALSDEERQHLVHDLMQARRDVKEAKASNDAEQLRNARVKVNAAKVALGERGPVWWSDSSLWALVVLTLCSGDSDPLALEVLISHSSDCDPLR